MTVRAPAERSWFLLTAGVVAADKADRSHTGCDAGGYSNWRSSTMMHALGFTCNFPATNRNRSGAGFPLQNIACRKQITIEEADETVH
jgi:hypothetical protein